MRHTGWIGVPKDSSSRKEETSAAARKSTTVRERDEGPRGEGGRRRRREEEKEEGRRSRTLGGSSQSSGWVSTRPVIIGAYLHEHTSNVPNQTSSHVARVGRHCGRVYKARLFLPLPRSKKRKKRNKGEKERGKNHAGRHRDDVRSRENVRSQCASTCRRVSTRTYRTRVRCAQVSLCDYPSTYLKHTKKNARYIETVEFA